ncbi:hypothetical protein, partial [Paramuribaculum intestinale]
MTDIPCREDKQKIIHRRAAKSVKMTLKQIKMLTNGVKQPRYVKNCNDWLLKSAILSLSLQSLTSERENTALLY